MKGKLLIINPGSTSTKIAVYVDGQEMWKESIEHSRDDVKKFNDPMDQVDWRQELVLDTVKKHGEDLKTLSAVVSRGGPFASVRSGAYEVSDEMLEISRTRPLNKHISRIGMAIARRIADPLGIKAYIYDAVSVDEMIPLVRIVGLKAMKRLSMGHMLNMRAAAIKFCKDSNLDYYSKNILVCHMGGGSSLSLHAKGRVIDMITDDEGPFAPERAGGLPGYQLVHMCFNSGADEKEMISRIQGKGGLVDMLGTADAREVEKLIADGDENAKLIYEAMALAIAKNLAKLAVVVDGQIDAIILTGGVSYSKMLTNWVEQRVKFIAPVHVLPGENEMKALAEGGYRVLSGEEKAHIYSEND
ncbi:MAG: butyrate kinase [Deltaproteobacteria bacterium]|jgi:butyrate kinase|nr:butyrate kinase [Deltaproteobacteria bacterium]